jgi:ATP-dependent Clp protease protease subunit
LAIVNTVGIWIVAALLVVVFPLVVATLAWVTIHVVAMADTDTVIETLIDRQIDAGFGATELRADDPLLQSRKIVLTHAINERTADDIASRLLYLDAIDPGAPIDLYLSTSGGWIDSAFTIIDAMLLIDAPVNTWAVGGCYSAGALVLTAGTGTRYAAPNALIMVHANLADSVAPFSGERLDRARYERLWQATADLPADWYPMTSDDAYYVTAEEALEFGMVDEIVVLE